MSDKVSSYLAEIRREASFIETSMLEALPFSDQGAEMQIEIINPEFTSLCPRTGLPDQGTITIRYRPRAAIVELKSLKYYFLQFRNTGIFYESLCPMILRHLAELLNPREMEIEARFTPRGGISSVIRASMKADPEGE